MRFVKKYEDTGAQRKQDGSARDTQVGGDHYKRSQYQPWDVLPDWLEGWLPFEAYLVGNIVKYIFRAPHKGDTITDLRKAQHYLAHLIEKVQEDRDDTASASFSRPTYGPASHGDQYP
jgi:hypothetical protein